jgi:Anti-sigma factor NepR
MGCPLPAVGEAEPSSLPGEECVLATPSNAIPNDLVEAREPQAEENGTPSEPVLSPDVVAHLGEQLRAYYTHLMSDPVPDHLVRLIEALDGKGSADHGN